MLMQTSTESLKNVPLPSLPSGVKLSTEGTVPYLNTNMPDCSGWKAFVLDGAFYPDCVGLMAEAGFQRAVTIEEADVCVFIGGADINPDLYGQEVHRTTHFSKNRDTVEEFFFHKCVQLGIPMFGICRGAQLLHALNGGVLWQNVNNHAGPDHWIVDIEDDVRVKVTSLHHQMLQANDKMQIVAVCEEQIADKFEDDSLTIDLTAKGSNLSSEIEIEAGCYLDTKCFFVQGHPEIGNDHYRAWTINKLYDFLVDAIPFMDDPEMEEIRVEISKQIG